jgi:hypothetical protein
MKKISTLLLLVILSFTAWQCSLNSLEDVAKEGDLTEWALPLIDTDKSFGDLIKDFDKQSQVEIKSDGSIILHYKGQYTARASIDIFAAFKNAIFPLTDTLMKIPLNTPKGVTVDYAIVKGGTLSWGFIINEPLEIELRVPQLQKNGISFITKFKASKDYIDTIDLKGWRLDANNGQNIEIIHDARRPNGERVNLTGSGLIQIKNFEFNLVRGFLGNDIFEAPADSIKIDFFQRWQGGEVRFVNPKMKVELDNSFGVPVRAISRIANVISLNGTPLALVSPLSQGVDINYPKLTEIGQSKRTTIVFDNSNSNFADIISANPVKVEYKIDGLTNPDTSIKTIGFLTDESRFSFQMYVDIPLDVKAKKFTITDSVDVNLTGYESVQSAELKILTDNKMPVDINLQGYFMNEKGVAIDSFFNKNDLILRGAPINAEGIPTGVKTAENFITLNEEQFKKIRLAKKINLKYSFSTTNEGSSVVRLLANQNVRVRMGLKFKVKK